MSVTELKETGPLNAEDVRLMNAYWRAANYLSVGQIYLYDNPLLREPLKLAHVKPRLLGQRLPLADSPPDLSPGESSKFARARLQGGGHDDDALRHGRSKRP